MVVLGTKSNLFLEIHLFVDRIACNIYITVVTSISLYFFTSNYNEGSVDYITNLVARSFSKLLSDNISAMIESPALSTNCFLDALLSSPLHDDGNKRTKRTPDKKLKKATIHLNFNLFEFLPFGNQSM